MSLDYIEIIVMDRGEKLKVFLDVVRKHDGENVINYGAHFVGMPDLYKRKIGGVYQVFPWCYYGICHIKDSQHEG